MADNEKVEPTRNEDVVRKVRNELLLMLEGLQAER
jgi:hypothetical protein